MIKVNLKKKRPSLNYLFEDAESTQRALKYAKDSWRKMQEKTENAVSDFANTILNSNGIDAETRRSAQSILADYAKNGIKGSEVDTEMPFELSNGETISFTPLYIKRNCETVIELMKRSTGDFQEVSDLLNDIKFIYGVKPNNGCETAFFYGGVIYFYMPFLAHFIKGYYDSLTDLHDPENPDAWKQPLYNGGVKSQSLMFKIYAPFIFVTIHECYHCLYKHPQQEKLYEDRGDINHPEGHRMYN